MDFNTENVMTENAFGTCGTVRRIFESVWLVPAVFCYAFLCWFLGSTEAVVAGFALVLACIFLFCKKINNAYALILYVSFFIQNIDGAFDEMTTDSAVLLALSVAIAGTSFIAFSIKTFVKEKGKLKKGKLFYPLLVLDAAFLLGGISRFDIAQFFVVAGLSLAVMIFYIFAINCTEDFGTYLAKVFVIGAVFISLEIIYAKYRNGNIFDGQVVDQRVFFFSAQCLNTAAIYLMLGMAGAFKLGVGKKTDVPFFLLCLYLMFAVFLSCCRTMMAVSLPVLIAVYVMFIVYSPKKRNFLIATIVLLVIAAFGAYKFRNKVLEFAGMIIDKLSRGLNGRDSLWEWCWDRFYEYPVFGYGFISDEVLPSLRTNVVLAHNTIIQWLCSLGVIGTALTSYFYAVKYKLLFKNFDRKRIFYLLAIGGVALSGIFDQSPAVDVFTYLTPILLLAGLENSLPQQATCASDGEKVRTGKDRRNKAAEYGVTEE